jgi:ADP-ribosylglycohydrolase
MTHQTKEQIKLAVVFASAVFICILMQVMYIRIKEDEKALDYYERRADRATHVIDSLEATNAQRMLEIAQLNVQLERNTERYEANISAIDSLDRNGLRKAMQSLLAELAGERYPGQSND